MTTDKQREANRINAQKSTGPRTEAGKLASRANALKHSMRIRSFDVLPHEDQDEFDDLIGSLFDYYGPTDPVQGRVVRRIAVHTWRLERIDRYDHVLASGRVADAMAHARKARRDRFDHARRTLLPTEQAVIKDGLGHHHAIDLRGLVEATADGCRWLLAAWRKLRATALGAKGWDAERELHTVRLLGFGPYTIADPATIDVVLANRLVQRPDRAHTPENFYNGTLPTYYDKPAIRLAYESGRAPADVDSALAVMVATADAQIARLERVLADRERDGRIGYAEDPEEAEKAGISACFDPGPDADRLRRYQVTIERQLMRAVELLEKLRRREKLSGRELKMASNGANEAISESVRDADEESNGANEPISADDVQVSLTSEEESSAESEISAGPTPAERWEHRRRRPPTSKLIKGHRSQRRRDGKPR